MKKINSIWISGLALALLVPLSLSAQETRITVTVEEDGKVVKDTTYSFEDAKEADHVLKMVEIMTGEGLDEAHEEYTYTMHTDADHASSMVFISTDGEKTVIKEIDGESFDILVDEQEDGKHTKKVKVIVSDEGEGEYTIITDGEEGEEIEEIIKVGEDGEEIKVIILKKKIDCDHDHDEEHEEEVEVEVEKTVKKKSKKQ